MSDDLTPERIKRTVPHPLSTGCGQVYLNL
ncbi:MAG: hypothetical protein JWQ86_60 [Mycobacterium sp.]|jgi:hypothetical protein|nr:hypothetical protein [Mycobacterium sp.]